MDRYALYVSRFISQAGQGLFFGVLVLLGGGSSAAAIGLSSILIAMVTASLLFGAPAGMLVDRIGAPRALALGGALRLAAIASALLVIGRPEYIAAAAFAYSAASQIFSPAELTLVRWIQPGMAGRAHSALLALQYGGQGLGAVLLAPLLFVVGGAPAMISGGVLAYVLVIAIGVLLVARLREVPTRAPRRVAFAWSDAIGYFQRDPRATYAAGLLTFAEVATKCLAVALPFYLLDQLDLSTTQVGIIVALGLIGAFTGLGWTARSFTVHVAERPMRLTLAGTVAGVLALAGFGWAIHTAAHHSDVDWIASLAAAANPGFLVALPVAVVLGLSFSVARIGARTVLSETAPPAAQGKIFAVQSAFADVLVIFPLIGVGAMAGYAGPRSALVLVAAIGALVFIFLEWAAMSRGRPQPTAVRHPITLRGVPEMHEAGRMPAPIPVRRGE